MTAKKKRRARGEGSITRRGKLWVGSLSVPGSKGKDRRVVYADTQRELIEKMDRERETLGLVRPSDMTVNHLLARWQESHAEELAPGTIEKRTESIARHIAPRIGTQRLADLSPAIIDTFYARMKRDSVGPTGRRTAAKNLVAALNYAVSLNLIASNPANDVKLPKAPEREMLFLTAEQSKVVCDVAREYTIGVLVAVAIGSGCRQGELLALNWEDVDVLADGILRIHIRRNLFWPRGGKPILKEPKSKAGRRSVILPAFASSPLAEHKRLAADAKLLSCPVFCKSNGEHRRRRSTAQAFRRIVIRASKIDASIPAKVRFHDLRHTCASLLLSAGASIRAVAARLGHSDPALTLRLYSHVLPTDDESLARKMEILLQ